MQVFIWISVFTLFAVSCGRDFYLPSEIAVAGDIFKSINCLLFGENPPTKKAINPTKNKMSKTNLQVNHISLQLSTKFIELPLGAVQSNPKRTMFIVWWSRFIRFLNNFNSDISFGRQTYKQNKKINTKNHSDFPFRFHKCKKRQLLIITSKWFSHSPFHVITN